MKIELLVALLTPFISWCLVWLYEYKKISSSKQTFFTTSARSFTLEYPKDKKDVCDICRSEADFNKWHTSSKLNHNSHSSLGPTYDPLLHPQQNPPVVSGIINAEVYQRLVPHADLLDPVKFVPPHPDQCNERSHPVSSSFTVSIPIQSSIPETPSASPDSFSQVSSNPVESYSSPSVDSSPSICDSSVASCDSSSFSSGGSDPSSSSF